MSTLLVWLLLAATPGPAKLPADWPAARAQLKQEIEASWARRPYHGPDGAWLARMAPPLPQVWPPDGKGSYVVHAFAAGLKPGLHDGEEVVAPWADWLITGGSTTVKDLGQPRRLGIQGVRPLQAEELKVFNTTDAAEQAVLALTRATSAPRLTPLVKRYYCLWSSNNAVIAGELQRLHPAFWKWLGCGG